MTFKLNDRQKEAIKTVFTCGAANVLLEGGARSSKTFLIVRNIVLRALKAPGSRHLILRFIGKDCKTSIFMDTFPKVNMLCVSEFWPNVKTLEGLN